MPPIPACDHCRRPDPLHNYCPDCGKQLKENIHNPKMCGHRLYHAPNHRHFSFCPKCGQNMDEDPRWLAVSMIF